MNLGFIGVGVMGSRMLANLIEGGHAVHAYDTSAPTLARAAELGARRCGSAREAAEERDAVLLSLPTPSIVEQVVLGDGGVLAARTVPPLLIDTSTSLPSVSRKIAEVAIQRGCQMLDAPVSGGFEGAAAGTLSIMVGGPADGFERVLPLLRLLGKEITRVGDVGAGNAMKLVNNALSGTVRAAVAEALMLGVLAGLDPETIFRVVSASTGNSRSFQNMVPRVLKGDFEPGFTVELMHKDLSLATDLGEQLGLSMPVVSLAREQYQATKAAGLGKKDCAAVEILFERLMGVEIRSRQV